MDDNSVNDDELNQMIANLQGTKTPPPVVTSNSGAPIAPQATVSGDGTAPALGATDAMVQPVIAPAVPAPEPPVPLAEPLVPNPVAAAPITVPTPELEGVKHDALTELRPLVDKLDLPPEDKFDTLLLLIRSTDDKTLIPAAHEAAKQIADEARRAQALLDIIKEIDFFGQDSAK